MRRPELPGQGEEEHEEGDHEDVAVCDAVGVMPAHDPVLSVSGECRDAVEAIPA